VIQTAAAPMIKPPRPNVTAAWRMISVAGVRPSPTFEHHLATFERGGLGAGTNSQGVVKLWDCRQLRAPTLSWSTARGTLVDVQWIPASAGGERAFPPHCMRPF
jgi:hypothetical protein